MGSALVYVLVVGVVAGVIYVATAMLAGRGEDLEPMPPGATPTRLPARDLTGGDLRELRFQQSFRGYRMSEVDWALDRLAAEVDTLRARLAVHESLPPSAGEDPETLTGVGYPAPVAPEEDPTPTDPTAGVPSGAATSTKGISHGHP
ncbi:DivIVA domain-containing protein [Actinomycetospora sp.]|jgi:DivIVA domain-containing protein|uniref:DivIVA domain-containing protein n=1 Tax=Actinomycetospora sp. TaxID=1872135 RepID=UPI002F3E5A2A